MYAFVQKIVIGMGIEHVLQQIWMADLRQAVRRTQPRNTRNHLDAPKVRRLTGTVPPLHT
eukprot:4242512-Karenia_brevis.AAC.1